MGFQPAALTPVKLPVRQTRNPPAEPKDVDRFSVRVCSGSRSAAVRLRRRRSSDSSKASGRRLPVGGYCASFTTTVSRNGVGKRTTEPFLAPVLKNQGNSLGEVLACFLHREALTVGARDSGQYEMKHSPSRSKIAVNSFRIIGTDPYDTAKSGWLSNTVAPPAAVPSLVS